MKTKQEEYEKLEKRLAKKYDCQLIYGKLKKKGHCSYKQRIIICPKPTSKKNLFVFFHELCHVWLYDNLEYYVHRTAKKQMRKELKKLNKKKNK